MQQQIFKLIQAVYTSPWGVPLLFGTLGLIAIPHHSMWRDEMNVWLMARDSASLAELLENIRYDRGHPPLWHLLVAGLQRLFDSPMAMQWLHFLIALLAIALFWVYSPFPRRVKTLFIFGYLPFYEFNLISRNYGLGMLLLFAVCALFPSRRRTYLGLAVLLGLMANSNIYALLIAVCLTLTLALEFWLEPQQRQAYRKQAPRYDLPLSGLIVVASGLISAYFILPPASTHSQGVFENWVLQPHLRHVLKSLGRWFAGYFLIIPNSAHLIDLLVCAAILLAIVGVLVLHFLAKPWPLLFFSSANLSILAFAYFKFLGRGMRHFGHFYLILIATLWLASYYPPSRRSLPDKLPRHWLNFAHTWQPRLLALILGVQLMGGLFDFSRNLVLPLSASRATAQYIQQTQLQNEFIVASRDANMAALSGYLDRTFYYPEQRSLGSYTLLFKGQRREVTQAEVLQQVSQLLLRDPAPPRILLLLHQPLNASAPGLATQPLAEFKQSWIDSERYYLYWVRRTHT